jgi:AcrR family transcriptional regulator
VVRRTGSPRRAARRKRSYKSAADRRRQILDCALSAFAERGYHETSIADICDRAAIGRATLYQYFADKRDLLVALADEIATRVTRSLDEREPLRIPPGFRPTEAQTLRFIEERFAGVLEVIFEDADTTRLVLRAGRGADGVVDEVLQKLDRAVLGRLEAELDHAKEAGVIRPVDSAFVARFFLGGIEKIVLSYVEDGRPLDVRAVAKEAALLEVFGIHTRTDTPR